jgi:prepilin-type N-terminal cleavage/methylation domain-containing protein
MLIRKERKGRGFTLVELLVVIAIISVLLGLLLPAVQTAREAARLTQCQNNLKQMGLAAQNYYSARSHFPAGCRSHLKDGSWTYGFAWSVELLPFLEYSMLYDKLDRTGERCVEGFHTGLIYQNHLWTYNTHNGALVKDLILPFLACPSTSLRRFGLVGSVVPGGQGAMSPDYVAITGAVDHSSAVDKDSQTHYHLARGIQSRGGVLLPNAFARMSMIRDGSSNTVLLGEQSGLCYDANGGGHECRSDYTHSFTMGTVPEANPDDRWYNTTTVRYPLNFRNWNSPGVGDTYFGCNRPIQSAHRSGVNMASADGSVRHFATETDIGLLFNLCNRDDGNAISID